MSIPDKLSRQAHTLGEQARCLKFEIGERDELNLIHNIIFGVTVTDAVLRTPLTKHRKNR